MRSNLWNRVGCAMRAFKFGSSGGDWGSGFLPGSQFDYKREAGPLWENSIVLACIYWIVRSFPEARLCIKTLESGSKESLCFDHPVLELIENPNPYYDSSVLWAGTLLSLNTDGNAYWYKARSGAGKVVELWYLPHYLVDPVWNSDGSEFIGGYRYQVEGQEIVLPQEDVIHFRAGIPHPLNSRKGLSPLAAVLREVCADNEASTFSASLLRNMGVPGLILTPSNGDFEFSPGQQEKFNRLWLSRFRGDQRGEPLVSPIPLNITTLGYTPEQMSLDKVRRIPEERITAALGLSAIVVGLGAGLDRATYSNYREAREAAYESNIIPTQRMLANQLTRHLLHEFGEDKGVRLAFDLSEIMGLREDHDRLHERVVRSYQGGVITRAEARSVLGWPINGEDEQFYKELMN